MGEVVETMFAAATQGLHPANMSPPAHPRVDRRMDDRPEPA